MPDSYTNLLYHIIFSTKDRRPLITDAYESRLYDYIGGTIRGLGGICLELNGADDHIHVLAKLRPDKALSDVLRELKANASGWMHNVFPELKNFSWQRGYGAFTVSQSKLFLRKAFFSKGLQQLLWHITVLESLFGENKQGLTKLLRNRTSLALGRTEKERKEVGKSFDKIYDLRSRLVHGNEELIDNKSEIARLCEARNLARRFFVWFLHYTDHVLEKTSINDRNDKGLPTREELLTVLDLNKCESRDRVKYLLSTLPESFPGSLD